MLCAEEKTLNFDAARLQMTPLEPALWQPLVRAIPGVGRLCLALLQHSELSWRGVIDQRQEVEPSPTAFARLPVGCLGELLGALCGPWLSQSEAAELESLEDYARVLADFPGLGCAQCRAQEARGEGAPDCPSCALGRAPDSAAVALLAAQYLGPGASGDMLAAALGQGLSPRQARLLAMQLATLQRVRYQAAAKLAPLQGA